MAAIKGKQERKTIGYEQEYPGAYRWPIYAYKCPECGKFSKDGGDITLTSEDGHDHYVCDRCAEEIDKEIGAAICELCQEPMGAETGRAHRACSDREIGTDSDHISPPEDTPMADGYFQSMDHAAGL